MLAKKHSVVVSLLAGAVLEAYAWKDVVRAVALEVEAVVEHAVGLQIPMVFPLSELDAPNSSVPATIVPPAVSLIVSVLEVSVLSYFTNETYPPEALVDTCVSTPAWLTFDADSVPNEAVVPLNVTVSVGVTVAVTDP